MSFCSANLAKNLSVFTIPHPPLPKAKVYHEVTRGYTAICPFHLGSRRSSHFFGASASDTSLVLNWGVAALWPGWAQSAYLLYIDAGNLSIPGITSVILSKIPIFRQRM